MSDGILITGAGQIGVALIALLHRRHGIRPVVLDVTFRQAFLDSLVPSHTYIPIQGSVTDPDLLADLLAKHRITRICHTAAILPMRVGHDPHPGFYHVNVAGTAILLFAALQARVRRFVMFSTNGVYQFRQYGVSGPVDEDYPTGLTIGNAYGSSKATAEALLAEVGAAGRIEAHVLRPGEIYGPVEPGPEDQGVYWQQMVDAAIFGREWTLQGHPEHRLDWVYGADAADAAARLLMADTVPSFAYNVSFGRCIGIYDIKAELDRLFPGNAVRLAGCGHGGWNHPLSTARLRRELGWQPQFDLAAGLSAYAAWRRNRSSEGGE